MVKCASLQQRTLLKRFLFLRSRKRDSRHSVPSTSAAGRRLLAKCLFQFACLPMWQKAYVLQGKGGRYVPMRCCVLGWFLLHGEICQKLHGCSYIRKVGLKAAIL